LTEWNRNDEKLMQAVKKGSLEDVQQLLVDSSKKRADPVKLDPNRGTTAYVNIEILPIRIMWLIELNVHEMRISNNIVIIDQQVTYSFL